MRFSGPVTITGLADSQVQELRALLLTITAAAARAGESLPQIRARLTTIEGKVDQILMDENLVKLALAKIDATTTKAATVVQTVLPIIKTIGDEMGALQTALAAALAAGTGVTQELVDMAGASAAKSLAVNDSLDGLIAPLQAIATKGIQNPVPIEVPPIAPALPNVPGGPEARPPVSI